jgi:NAD(P)-dependent dehydrogenase (short-subunit alcohol dehydrogenase family)
VARPKIAAGEPRAGRFAGQGVVVSGAGRGIGRATAESFAGEGAGVVLFGWHADSLEAAAASIRVSGGSCEVVLGDVASKTDVERAVASCSSAFGRIDVMVANAGIADFVPFLEGSEAAWEQQIGIDVKGTWLCVQAAARQMVQEGHGGSIVVVSSTNAFQPEQGGVFYNTAKSGQVAVMQTAAMELAPRGIRVNGVAPGIVRTRLAPVTEDPRQREVFLARTPMGRFAEPVEIARPILFLCSDDASFIAGELLVVDGAYSVGLPIPIELGEPFVPGAVR